MTYSPIIANALGSIADAVVLEAIHKGQARVLGGQEFEGKHWHHKARPEWAAELGMTQAQLRGSIKRLQAKGLVTAIRNPHNPLDQTRWLAVNEVAVEQVINTGLTI